MIIPNVWKNKNHVPNHQPVVGWKISMVATKPPKNHGNIFKTLQPPIFELLSNLHEKHFDDVPVIIESFFRYISKKHNPIQ